jgi:hypothetical protein
MVNLPALPWLGVPPASMDQRIEQISFLQLIWKKYFGILALNDAEC